MNNFKVIYKILSALDAALDDEVFDTSSISPEQLGITEARWEHLMVMLADSGYIDGVTYYSHIGDYRERLAVFQPMITLRGLEYLADPALTCRTVG